MSDQWIKVTDRLPELDKRVLVVEYGEYLSIASYYGDYWLESEYGRISVTHWMPLPEPPKDL